MALTSIDAQSDDTSGGQMSTLKWDTLRAVHGGISVDASPIARCGRSGEHYTDDDGYADDELNDLGSPPDPHSPPYPYRESNSKESATSAFQGAVSLHHPDHDLFAVLPVTPQKSRRVYDSDTSASPSVGSPSLWPSVESAGSAESLDAQLLPYPENELWPSLESAGSAESLDSQLLPYPENERDIEMTPGDLCSIRTPDLHRVAPTMARDRVQQNLNRSAHLPAYLGRVVSPSAKYDGLQSSPAKFEVVEEDEDDVDID